MHDSKKSFSNNLAKNFMSTQYNVIKLEKGLNAALFFFFFFISDYDEILFGR